MSRAKMTLGHQTNCLKEFMVDQVNPHSNHCLPLKLLKLPFVALVTAELDGGVRYQLAIRSECRLQPCLEEFLLLRGIHCGWEPILKHGKGHEAGRLASE